MPMDTGSPRGYFSEKKETCNLEVLGMLFLPPLPGAVPALHPEPRACRRLAGTLARPPNTAHRACCFIFSLPFLPG